MGVISRETVDSGIKVFTHSTISKLDINNFLQKSSLQEKIKLLDFSNIEQICYEFEQLLNHELTSDELTSLLVASIMLFLSETRKFQNTRNRLLQQTFRFIDILDPKEVHFTAKIIFENLKNVSGDNLYRKLLKICHHIFSISNTGYMMTLCLLWTILQNIAGLEIEMYRIFELSHLITILNNIDYKILIQSNASKPLILTETVEFLINAIVFAPNKEICDAGYKNYFSYTLEDLKKLYLWTNTAFFSLQVTSKTVKENWEIWMLIKEKLNVSISEMLSRQIRDMEEIS